MSGNLKTYSHRKNKKRPTKRAPDAGDSGAISSSFLRLSIFPVGRRSAARPSAGNANRWALADLFGLAIHTKLFFLQVIDKTIELL